MVADASPIVVQPAGGVGRVFQELLDPRGDRARQPLQHRLGALLRDRFEQIRGVVRVELLDETPQLVVRTGLEDLGERGRREPRDDRGRDRRRKQAEDRRA